MTFPGTNVMALSSSFKKGTGPRTGSLLYVSESENISTLPYENKSISSVNVEICTAVFYRYGFDKKYRSEAKPIAMIAPLPKEDAASAIKSMSSILASVQTHKFKDLFDAYCQVPIKGLHALIIPAHTVINSSTYEQKLSYIRSIFDSAKMIDMILFLLRKRYYKLIQHYRYDRVNKEGRLDALISRATSRKEKINIIKYMVSDQELYTHLLRLSVDLSNVLASSSLRRYVKKHHEIFEELNRQQTKPKPKPKIYEYDADPTESEELIEEDGESINDYVDYNSNTAYGDWFSTKKIKIEEDGRPHQVQKFIEKSISGGVNSYMKIEALIKAFSDIDNKDVKEALDVIKDYHNTVSDLAIQKIKTHK